MNIKDNQRTRLSKLLFKNAMMDLLKEKKTVNKITVKELCERAQLNRSTFYTHYNEPANLLSEIEDDIIGETKNHLNKIWAENDVGAHKYILSFLNYIKSNDKQFRTLLIDNTSTDFKNRFLQLSISQFVENIDIPAQTEQYIYSYILNGSSGIIIQWIRSNYACDDTVIVNLLFSLNRNALVNLKQ